VRNTNMLTWHRRLWLIDHGASLYFHHSPGSAADRDRAFQPFPLIREHVLLRHASMLETVDAAMASALTADPGILDGIVALIPDAWLGDASTDHAWDRQAYRRYLRDRLEAPRAFVAEAVRVR
jgi:hypothetical protein